MRWPAISYFLSVCFLPCSFSRSVLYPIWANFQTVTVWPICFILVTISTSDKIHANCKYMDPAFVQKLVPVHQGSLPVDVAALQHSTLGFDCPGLKYHYCNLKWAGPTPLGLIVGCASLPRHYGHQLVGKSHARIKEFVSPDQKWLEAISIKFPLSGHFTREVKLS